MSPNLWMRWWVKRWWCGNRIGPNSVFQPSFRSLKERVTLLLSYSKCPPHQAWKLICWNQIQCYTLNVYILERSILVGQNHWPHIVTITYKSGSCHRPCCWPRVWPLCDRPFSVGSQQWGPRCLHRRWWLSSSCGGSACGEARSGGSWRGCQTSSCVGSSIWVESILIYVWTLLNLM